jgi:hypothetical protein
MVSFSKTGNQSWGPSTFLFNGSTYLRIQCVHLPSYQWVHIPSYSMGPSTILFSGSIYLSIQWVHIPSYSMGPSTILFSGSIYLSIKWVHIPSYSVCPSTFLSVGPSTFLFNGSIYHPIQCVHLPSYPTNTGEGCRAVTYIPASSGERIHTPPPPPCDVTSCTTRGAHKPTQCCTQHCPCPDETPTGKLPNAVCTPNVNTLNQTLNVIAGRVMAQAICGRPLSPDDQVRYQTGPCRICGGHSVTPAFHVHGKAFWCIFVSVTTGAHTNSQH